LKIIAMILRLFGVKTTQSARFSTFGKKFNEITARTAGFCKEKSGKLMIFAVGATLSVALSGRREGDPYEIYVL
jgi:cytochrome b